MPTSSARGLTFVMFCLLSASPAGAVSLAAVNPALPGMDRARYSLWPGAPAPSPIPASIAPALTDEQLSGAAGQPFELSELRDAVAQPPLPAAQAANPGALFVSVQLDIDPAAGPLKDAVADLGQKAQFTPDARFSPQWLGQKSDRVTVMGWMPGSRLGDAVRVRGVERVEIGRPSPRPPAPPAFGRFVVGIRVREGDPRSVGEIFAKVLRELGESASFHWRRTIGYQAVPGSKDVALVIVGEAPLRRVGELMGHPDVVKIMPSPDSGRPLWPSDPQPPSGGGFLRYALARAPLLIVATGMLLASSRRR